MPTISNPGDHLALHVASMLLLATAMMLAVVLPTQAQELEKNIMTGGAKGTYIQIGRNLADVSARCGYTLNVQESAGSLENLVAVKNRLFTQFGIVQSDVLEYVRAYSQNDPDLRRSLYGVRIMFPLYNEEVHVLATRDIESLKDLSKRKVAVGAKDSGTFLTANLMLDIMRVEDAERLPVGSADALPQLLSGQIDALFYVAGAPTKLFEDTQIDGAKFHLLDINEAPLRATYLPAEIPGGTYPFQPDPVDGVAVKAVLMTFDYIPKKSDYHARSCRAAADMAAMLLTNLEELRANGHPKWKNVDLTAIPPGWKVSDCVKDGMRPDYQLTCNEPIPTVSNEATSAVPADQEYLDLLKQRLSQ